MQAEPWLTFEPGTERRVVDAIVSGVQEPGESHDDLLHAFADGSVLSQMSRAFEERGYRLHEFGDPVLAGT